VYIWQGLAGKWSYLNGQETTVTGDAVTAMGSIGAVVTAHPTDTRNPAVNQTPFMYAVQGMLRPKTPPPGEQSVLDMFKQNEGVEA